MPKNAQPFLLLDVDGVLAVKPGHRRDKALGRHEVIASDGQSHTIWLDPRHRQWLTRLAETFTPVWTTGWEHDAPRLLGPLLGLPAMPVIEFTQRPELGVPIDKLPDVIDFVGDNAAAWVDDELSGREQAWAEGRLSPTLLISPDPALGLTSQHVNQLLRFAESV